MLRPRSFYCRSEGRRVFRWNHWMDQLWRRRQVWQLLWIWNWGNGNLCDVGRVQIRIPVSVNVLCIVQLTRWMNHVSRLYETLCILLELLVGPRIWPFWCQRILSSDWTFNDFKVLGFDSFHISIGLIIALGVERVVWEISVNEGFLFRSVSPFLPGLIFWVRSFLITGPDIAKIPTIASYDDVGPFGTLGCPVSLLYVTEVCVALELNVLRKGFLLNFIRKRSRLLQIMQFLFWLGSILLGLDLLWRNRRKCIIWML